MSNLLAVGPIELLVMLLAIPVLFGIPLAIIYGIVRLVKFAWKD